MTIIGRRVVLGGVLASAACTTVGVPASATITPMGRRIVLPSGRAYWLCGATGGSTWRPLVVGLHGHGLDAANTDMVFWSDGGWHTHATQTGYTLALGEGLGGTWNPGGAWAQHQGQDDVAYLADITDDAGARTPIDPDQRFISGFSAGAAMAWTAMVRRPDLFAAHAGASGWAAEYPTRPLDSWHCHGTADTTVPIRGGRGIFGTMFPPAVLEAERAHRGSRVCLYPHAGGHGVPGWMAREMWRFWTVTRASP